MGLTTSDPARFAPLAILYSEYIAFVVRAEAAIRSGADLIGCFAGDARSIRIALSTSLGNSNHVAVAKVIRHAGGDPGAANIRVSIRRSTPWRTWSRAMPTSAPSPRPARW